MHCYLRGTPLTKSAEATRTMAKAQALEPHSHRGAQGHHDGPAWNYRNGTPCGKNDWGGRNLVNVVRMAMERMRNSQPF